MTEATSVLAIAQALVRCPSVTPEEAGALHALERILRAAGFTTSIVAFSEPGAPEVQNLYARIGIGAPHFLFAGHTDVVPPGEPALWRFDPFAAEIADGMLWGRGAADMKGAIAASVMAAVRFIGKRGVPHGSIGFLVTGDEEGPAVNGTAKLLAWAHARGERFDHCVLGEPTNRQVLGDMIKIGRRGSLNGEIVVHGKQGHVAYPHLADNPIPAMLRILAALKATPLDGGTAHFEPSNLEITTIDIGNPARNVIPGRAQARFNVRFNDCWTPTTLPQEIRRRLEAAASGANCAVRFEQCNATAFVTAPGGFTELVTAAIEAETGRRPAPSTTGGTSDARFIKSFCPVVEFGLVGETMHAVNERVAIADLEKLAAIYERLLQVYFSGAPASRPPAS